MTVVVVEPGDDCSNAAAGMAFSRWRGRFKSGMQLAVIHGDPGSKATTPSG